MARRSPSSALPTFGGSSGPHCGVIGSQLEQRRPAVSGRDTRPLVGNARRQRQARDNELTHDPCLPPSAVSASQRAAHHRSATRCGRGLARALCVFAPRAAKVVRPAVVAGRDSRQSFARQHRRAAHGWLPDVTVGNPSHVSIDAPPMEHVARSPRGGVSGKKITNVH
jgi:hypothetical protein